jgi:tetratricopeptide (TPR) repeat protein
MACGLLGACDPAAAVAQPAGADPAALYANREALADAEQAASLWEQALAADPGDFDAAWKLARACYWLGGHRLTAEARTAAFTRGMAAAQAAIAARSNLPAGYFWLAANMGGLAELGGIRSGLRYRKPVRDNLETVLALDPAFQKGSADRALGRWYFKVPGLFGGSKTKSVQHLRASLSHHPESIASRYFLAETYESMNRDAEAIALLKEIETLPVDPEWGPEDREFKAKAAALREKLERR